MATTMLKRLRETLEEIEAERERLAQEAEHFRAVIAYYESLGEGVEDGAHVPAKAMDNAMWRILEEEGKPLHIRDIHERLRQRGIHVPGKIPANNVSAHLSNDPRFENVGKGVWGLKSWRKAQQRAAALTAGQQPRTSSAAADARTGTDLATRVVTLPVGRDDAITIERDVAQESESDPPELDFRKLLGSFDDDDGLPPDDLPF
ncbi:MAG: winged helix-turn-helix domain-containing protein [Chloroflexi bacterium]|nr:winged helix-turn-helix domain-containing protein [Chloroflexota bacterium]